MPRFVILQHDHPFVHWDLMLEVGAALRTWRLPAPPTEQPKEATPLGDHRRMYLDYEGAVSGDRGHVKRWDAGEYEVREQGDDRWRVALHGRRWQGTATLTRRNETAWDADFTPTGSQAS